MTGDNAIMHVQLSSTVLWHQAFLESPGEGGVLYVAMGTLATLGEAPESSIGAWNVQTCILGHKPPSASCSGVELCKHTQAPIVHCCPG